MSQVEEYFEAVRILNIEARLLDEMKYEEWLTWLSPKIRYRMPTRFVRKATERDKEFSSLEAGVDFLHEDFDSLKMRVEKTRHRMSWTDNPASRMVHCVSNVEVLESTESQMVVNSVSCVYRSRFANYDDQWALRRSDTIVREGERWLLLEREIYNPTPVLSSANLAVFF